MDLIHLMNVFIAVGEEECLAAAARRLDLSPAAVTRAVSALESRLDVLLLERMTRTVRLTSAGRHHLASMRTIIRNLDAADQAVSGANADHTGHLSVTASVVFGRMFVLPCISDYMQQFPRLEVAACFVDRPVNLVDDGHDVAVRIGHLPDSGLKALTVGAVRRVMCAAPAYLAEQGVPRRPAELARHALIARKGAASRQEAIAPGLERLPASRLRARLSVTGSEPAIDAALAGLGIVSAMHYQVAQHVSEGRLAIVLADCESPPLPVQVLHRQGRYGSSKVRNFIDLLVGRLRQEASLH
jgi:DNA-binding transcriptional LysR family regulator